MITSEIVRACLDAIRGHDSIVTSLSKGNSFKFVNINFLTEYYRCYIERSLINAAIESWTSFKSHQRGISLRETFSRSLREMMIALDLSIEALSHPERLAHLKMIELHQKTVIIREVLHCCFSCIANRKQLIYMEKLSLHTVIRQEITEGVDEEDSLTNSRELFKDGQSWRMWLKADYWKTYLDNFDLHYHLLSLLENQLNSVNNLHFQKLGGNRNLHLTQSMSNKTPATIDNLSYSIDYLKLIVLNYFAQASNEAFHSIQHVLNRNALRSLLISTNDRDGNNAIGCSIIVSVCCGLGCEELIMQLRAMNASSNLALEDTLERSENSRNIHTSNTAGQLSGLVEENLFVKLFAEVRETLLEQLQLETRTSTPTEVSSALSRYTREYLQPQATALPSKAERALPPVQREIARRVTSTSISTSTPTTTKQHKKPEEKETSTSTKSQNEDSLSAAENSEVVFISRQSVFPSVLTAVPRADLQRAKESLLQRYNQLEVEVEAKRLRASWQIRRLKSLQKQREQLRMLYCDVETDPVLQGHQVQLQDRWRHYLVTTTVPTNDVVDDENINLPEQRDNLTNDKLPEVEKSEVEVEQAPDKHMHITSSSAQYDIISNIDKLTTPAPDSPPDNSGFTESSAVEQRENPTSTSDVRSEVTENIQNTNTHVELPGAGDSAELQPDDHLQLTPPQINMPVEKKTRKSKVTSRTKQPAPAVSETPSGRRRLPDNPLYRLIAEQLAGQTLVTRSHKTKRHRPEIIGRRENSDAGDNNAVENAQKHAEYAQNILSLRKFEAREHMSHALLSRGFELSLLLVGRRQGLLRTCTRPLLESVALMNALKTAPKKAKENIFRAFQAYYYKLKEDDHAGAGRLDETHDRLCAIFNSHVREIEESHSFEELYHLLSGGFTSNSLNFNLSKSNFNFNISTSQSICAISRAYFVRQQLERVHPRSVATATDRFRHSDSALMYALLVEHRILEQLDALVELTHFSEKNAFLKDFCGQVLALESTEAIARHRQSERVRLRPTAPVEDPFKNALKNTYINEKRERETFSRKRIVHNALMYALQQLHQPNNTVQLQHSQLHKKLEGLFVYDSSTSSSSSAGQEDIVDVLFTPFLLRQLQRHRATLSEVEVEVQEMRLEALRRTLFEVRQSQRNSLLSTGQLGRLQLRFSLHSTVTDNSAGPFHRPAKKLRSNAMDFLVDSSLSNWISSSGLDKDINSINYREALMRYTRRCLQLEHLRQLHADLYLQLQKSAKACRRGPDEELRRRRLRHWYLSLAGDLLRALMDFFGERMRAGKNHLRASLRQILSPTGPAGQPIHALLNSIGDFFRYTSELSLQFTSEEVQAIAKHREILAGGDRPAGSPAPRLTAVFALKLAVFRLVAGCEEIIGQLRFLLEQDLVSTLLGGQNPSDSDLQLSELDLRWFLTLLREEIGRLERCAGDLCELRYRSHARALLLHLEGLRAFTANLPPMC